MSMRDSEETCREKLGKLLYCMRVFNVEGMESGVPVYNKMQVKSYFSCSGSCKRRDQAHRTVLWGFAMLHNFGNVVA
jgi:hypothetical protein